MAKLAADLDGMTMGGLASKGRYGDTMIAHINPQEAEMLMEEGGSGTINPMTGLPEFYFDDPGYSDADMSGAEGDVTDTSGIGEDPDATVAGGPEGDATGGVDTSTLSAPEGTSEEIEAFYGLAPGTLGPQGVGTGGPGEFAGFGVGRNKDTVNTLNRTFNKEGIPKEFVPYYNSLKDRGLSNEQAMATLAAVAGTPGGAASLTSGYTDGYSYGGPMGTLEDLIETGQTASLERRAKKAREEAAKEEQEAGYLAGGIETETEQGFGDRFASILGLDDFSLDSLNPFSTTLSPQQQAIKASLSDQGLIVQDRSTMDYIFGGLGSSLLSKPVAAAKFIAEQATDTGIFALATDPVTGFEYLVDNSGGLQLASGQLGDEPNQDGGNEPAITTRRKSSTQTTKIEDAKKEESKKGFPQQSLPSLTQSGLEMLQYAYRNDPPEVLDNILNKYTLPNQTSGLRALA